MKAKDAGNKRNYEIIYIPVLAVNGINNDNRQPKGGI